MLLLLLIALNVPFEIAVICSTEFKSAFKKNSTDMAWSMFSVVALVYIFHSLSLAFIAEVHVAHGQLGWETFFPVPLPKRTGKVEKHETLTEN